jgi:hypothetical protein
MISARHLYSRSRRVTANEFQQIAGDHSTGGIRCYITREGIIRNNIVHDSINGATAVTAPAK